MNSKASHESAEETLDTSEEIDERVLTEPITNIERRFYVHKLIPPNAGTRVKPLHDLETELLKIHGDYCVEVHDLERRYHEWAEEHYALRAKIISGKHEPEGNEAKPLWKEKTSEVDLKSYAEFYEKSQKLPEDYIGVPNFWLHIFMTADTISQIIQKQDIKALQFLKDVSIDYDHTSFTLEFHFKENPYFENNLLVKQYFLENKLEEDPYGFEGLRISKCTGCRIHWKPHRDITVKAVNKPDEREKFVQVPSFFHFFNPPLVKDPSNVDEETCKILNLHFKIGNFFREDVIPKAMLYFTGDLVDNIDDEDDLVNSDEECGDFFVRDDDKHFANVARVLHKIHWN